MSVVLVTGCNSGFGLATARVLAERGDHVFATVLPNDPSGMGEIEAAQASGLPITIAPLDVTDAAAAAALVARIVAEAGRIDALVNNAGVSTMAALEEVSIDDARRMFEINYFGPLRLIQLVLPHMRRQGAGRIVNVSSGAGFIPTAWQTTYVATKHAIDGMSFGLAAEVHRFGIRVSIVSPGVFATAIGAKLWPPSQDSGEPWYGEMTALVVDGWRSIVEGRDPVAVALAIDACIHGEHPPARVFVGADSQKGAQRRREMSDDEWAAVLLRPPFRKPAA
ncbi:MAG: SDR family oxidoreductase [Phenylobacterium sp.]|uniref:SDR family oxidoreductase n=1 Tax=Phenylobacterium sp. TaxID=1871053 RepID=UPI002732EA12|nr:SDR family oxidoreductase [Phenylobacterium sp.]MDP3174392.1 SDR family oxidoreductase [Phenylobacterium sp.]